jgi:nicotinamide-nucleotide amidase
LDSNAAWLAAQLTSLGFDVVLQLTLGDRVDDIAWGLELGCGRGDVLICTGGLGPTQDDLTVEVVAKVTQDELSLNQATLDHIQALYKSIGRVMPPANIKQAMLPSRATILQNDWGTAPGVQIEHNACQAYFVPGVPREMKALWKHRILPDLQARFDLPPERLLVFRCMGVHESKLAELMAPFQGRQGVVLGFRTMLPENQVKLRLSAELTQEGEEALREEALQILGKNCYGVNSGNLVQVIGDLLRERKETLATAESCTGGNISAQITSAPGSSSYFLQGVCAYANAAKTQQAGVPAELIQAHGAVSEPVAIAMAEGIRDRAGSSYGLSTTGIAGPGGGTPDKPVGTVHIACATPTGTHHIKLALRGSRERIVSLAAGATLDMLRRHLQGLL